MIKIELEKNSSDQQEVTTYATNKQIQFVLPYLANVAITLYKK